MSEKNLKIRNQFANKLIIKIEKLNNDIKLLAKVDKKLSNGNNQIGGSPSIHTNLRDAQFKVASTLLSIKDNQPTIESVIRTNELNIAANKDLQTANRSLITINQAIEDLAKSIAKISIIPLPSLTQIDGIAHNLKTLIGDQEVLVSDITNIHECQSLNYAFGK